MDSSRAAQAPGQAHDTPSPLPPPARGGPREKGERNPHQWIGIGYGGSK